MPGQRPLRQGQWYIFQTSFLPLLSKHDTIWRLFFWEIKANEKLNSTIHDTVLGRHVQLWILLNFGTHRMDDALQFKDLQLFVFDHLAYSCAAKQLRSLPPSFPGWSECPPWTRRNWIWNHCSRQEVRFQCCSWRRSLLQMPSHQHSTLHCCCCPLPLVHVLRTRPGYLFWRRIPRAIEILKSLQLSKMK